jgi:hypothetical protein
MVGMIPHAMAEVMAERNELVVRMGRWEQFAALRGDVRVPLAAVRAAVIRVELDSPAQFGRLLVSVHDAQATLSRHDAAR